MSEDNTAVSLCIGTFDPSGIPISAHYPAGGTAKPLHECTTVAFQSITINLLMAQCFDIKPAKLTYIDHQDGFRIRLEQTLKGFVGYIEAIDRLA